MVIEKKINTSLQITAELGELVAKGGFQKVQYLRQLDQLYELQTELSNLQLDMNRTKLSAEKAIEQHLNRLNNAKLQLQYQNVMAPVSGTIFDPGLENRGYRS